MFIKCMAIGVHMYHCVCILFKMCNYEGLNENEKLSPWLLLRKGQVWNVSRNSNFSLCYIFGLQN